MQCCLRILTGTFPVVLYTKWNIGKGFVEKTSRLQEKAKQFFRIQIQEGAGFTGKRNSFPLGCHGDGLCHVS